jgi:glutathione-regulated potassium-efflux system ancillary protein KefG
MSRILILFAHPLMEKSRVHAELLEKAKTVEDVTINDLYERYPEYDIDVEREKKLLLDHDIIAWQHPFYWYSAPPLLKQWQDLVLEHGWAYGKRGNNLAGKKIFNVLTSGGSMEAYQTGGFNKYSVHDYLRPFERTAELCRMIYWPPYWVHGVHRMEANTIKEFSEQYKNLLTALAKNIFSDEDIITHSLLNNLVPINSTSSK